MIIHHFNLILDMSYDDTIQPIAYSFRGNSVQNNNNFFDNNINPESHNCGFI